MAKTLDEFMEQGDQGYVLYNGPEFVYKDDVRAMHYADYLHKAIDD